MANDSTLTGKVAVVTGAGRGIGRAIAVALAGAGADVVLAARTGSQLNSATDDVLAMGRRALSVPTDVSSSIQVDALVKRAIDHFGGVDILVNNAGTLLAAALVPLPESGDGSTASPVAPTSRLSDDQWRRVMDVNLTGVFYCCRAVAPHMLAKRSGKIINISSNNAHQAMPTVSAYNASKAGVNMLTRVLALEWAAYGVNVNALAPGEYHTAMTSSIWTDETARLELEDLIPMHRGGNVEDLGALAVYLASAASDYMTGQVLYLDGGLTAK
jgi:NAD(P)-dependent dehydrogenase (short-subunit alcohol dehydrogenase family)